MRGAGQARERDRRGGRSARGASPAALRPWLRAAAALVRRLIGVPDYERYLAHMSARYPGIPPMDRGSFEAERLAARYRNGGGVRCC